MRFWPPEVGGSSRRAIPKHQISGEEISNKNGAEATPAPFRHCVFLLQVIYPGPGIGGAAVGTRHHRNHRVFPLFAVEIFHAQQHLIFLQPELRLLTYRKKHGMLFIPPFSTKGKTKEVFR